MDFKFIGALAIIAIVAGSGGYWYGTQQSGPQNSQQGVRTFNRNGVLRFGGGAVFGRIVAKDANSMTVQLIEGPNASSTNSGATGSKIVLYDNSTQVEKNVSGSTSDLAIGTNVIVNGTANSDGSITAQSIQIRPAGLQFGGRGQ